MDRLLSEQEMAEIDNRHTSPSPYGGVILNMINARKECLASQLAKADKEWVEWLESNLFHETDYGLEFNCLSKFALGDWQERKKEIVL
jgi:hypothetical protein